MKRLSLFVAAAALTAPTYAQCPTPDALEDNDDCANAVAVPGNAATGLNVDEFDRDFYSVTVADQERITVDLSFLDANGDIDLYIFDPLVQCDTDVIGAEGAGAGALDYGFSATDDETASYDNLTGASQNLIVEVRLYSAASAGVCNDYDIAVTTGVIPPTPTCTTADAYEPNLDCTSAATISSGSYTGLNIADGDNDYYAVTVPAGNTLDVQIFFVDDFADVDLYIWDPLIACDTNVVGNGGGGGPLDYGFSASDNEDATYTNTTGAAQNLIIEIDMFTGGGCNDYDMDISGAGIAGPSLIGSQFCAANPNSTGQAGICSAFGLTTVADNDVELIASQLPPGQFGIFVVAQAEVPGVPLGEGLLCLGGQIGRYQEFSQIFQVDPAGEGSLVIDLTAVPQPSALVAVQPGDTWKFQAWHRDGSATGPTSNFTTGVSVDFN